MEIKTKYKVGNEVWFLDNNKVLCGIVKTITLSYKIDCYGITKHIENYTLKRETDKDGFDNIIKSFTTLFPTKQDLLNSL